MYGRAGGGSAGCSAPGRVSSPWSVAVYRCVHPFDPHATGVETSAARAVPLTIATPAHIRARCNLVDRALEFMAEV